MSRTNSSSVSFFLGASSFQSVFSLSGSPSGSEGADPVLVTNEVSIAASDIGSASSVSRKSARRSVSRPRSVLLEHFQQLELSVGQMFASIESCMSRFDQASGS